MLMSWFGSSLVPGQQQDAADKRTKNEKTEIKRRTIVSELKAEAAL